MKRSLWPCRLRASAPGTYKFISPTTRRTSTRSLFSAQGTPLPRSLPTLPGYPSDLMLADFERDWPSEEIAEGFGGLLR
jgi:hypothetical protein